jgi:hypothetical protein
MISDLAIAVYTAKEWRNEQGKYHREDGPAVEYTDGTKMWYLNGKPHRLDGPAYETVSGDKVWYADGKLHRLDGPAVVYSDSDNLYYVDDKQYSKRNFPIGVIQFLLNCNEKTAKLILEAFNDTV